ncbi:MAG: M4 family metallopeptidase [Ferruginibacter sp.]|nr:M4 family metallopeptidase [Cytophagales bacterium]
MKRSCTYLVGLLGCGWLLALPAANAQRTPAPFAAKAHRNATPVDTRSLHATVTDGSRNAPNARLQARVRTGPFAPLPALNVPARVPGGLEIKTSARTGLPLFIKGTLPGLPNARTDARQASLAYLDAVKDVMRIKNPASEFTVTTTETDPLHQTHQRMHQVYRGIPVYGGEVILHSRGGQIQALNGRYFPTPALTDVIPAVASTQATTTALRDVQARTNFHPLSGEFRKLMEYEGPSARLVIYHSEENPRLAWHVSVRPNVVEHWEYFVDARNGSVIHYLNHTCSADGPRTATSRDLNSANQTIQTYQVGNNHFMMDASRAMFKSATSKFPDDPVGVIWTMDLRSAPFKEDVKPYHVTSANNAWNNPAAISAQYNGGRAFEYYRTVHNRNSIDGQGGNVISFINVADKDGKGLDNAFWNGKFIFYGNGNVGFKALAASLDVAAHEMTHGVISNSANLEYEGQSGAINESMADVFGVLIDNDDWTLGEEVVKTTVFKSGALRSMADPHNGGTSLSDRGYQPRVMAELYTGTEDNGGVHINSGIPNFAFYKFATAVGRPKAEKVYYQALTKYLTTQSQFVDLRLAVVQAATDLHGATSTEVAAVRSAFDAVGILEGGRTDEPTQLPENPGQDFILVHDASTTDPNTWYVARPDGTSLVARSKTESINRPTVTDDGEAAVFVAGDRRLKTLSLKGTAQESVLQNEPIWQSVAVSKDGTKLAAVTTSADASIYVYDFGTKKWNQFKLYNPTYTEGVTTGGVRYADAIEWDYGGEYLIYDAYNEVDKGDGESIDYWDVGVLRAWDKAKNNFGDGKIDKLFTSLPENVSIGNPALSKKSPSIVAFDYFDTSDDTYSVIAANLLTSDVGLIATNNTMGYPTYSKSDDRLAYTTVSTKGDTSVAVIGLKADKINPNGTPTQILREAKWAVWFAQGNRAVKSAAKDILSFSLAGANAPANGAITGNAIALTVPANANVTRLIATFSHSPLSTVNVGSVAQVSGTTPNNFSQPVTYRITAEDGSTKNYVVTVRKEVITGTPPPASGSRPFTLFPNPNNGRFRLTWEAVPTGSFQLEVVNLAGQVVHRQTVPALRNGPSIELELPHAQPGWYLLQVRSEGQVIRKKLVVETSR